MDTTTVTVTLPQTLTATSILGPPYQVRGILLLRMAVHVPKRQR